MTDIKRLLFVTKFEELGFDALRSILDLRKDALNHVVFVNVIERDRVAMHRGTGYNKEEETKLREKANIRFIDWAEDLFEQGMEVGVYIVVGSVVNEVIAAAKKEDADLIVIGTPHKGVLEHLYSGSDVTEIIRRASIPVLVYKHLSKTKIAIEKPFERPLLATDWSPASLRGVEYLQRLKDVIDEIHIVHVASEKDLVGDSAMKVQQLRKDTRKKLEEICDQFEANGIRAESHVYIGEPVEEIEKAAREHQASMVVIGSSGKSAWVEKWLGSIPQTIAEKSVYPTLLIPFEKKSS